MILFRRFRKPNFSNKTNFNAVFQIYFNVNALLCNLPIAVIKSKFNKNRCNEANA